MLRLNTLAAGYGAKTVISNVSFELEPGQILALLGHNGAGKTTTLRVVMGLLPLRAGDVTFDGRRTSIGSTCPAASQWVCACYLRAEAYSLTSAWPRTSTWWPRAT
jgi:ABC-type multidrug transport system ATPase subunit